MVVFAIHFHQARLEVGADLREHPAQTFDGIAIEHLSAIFCHKDQMDMHLKNAVSASANFVVINHRPKYNRSVKRFQAFKFALQPNGEQQRLMRCFSGSCRFVFNKALAMQKALYEQGEKKLGYAGLCKVLTGWRNDLDTLWLSDAPVHPLQQTLKDLERAYTNFFARRADFPRFKKKGMGDNFRYPDAKQFKIDQGNSRVFLPKLGWVRYRNSRDMPGVAKNITVSGCGGKWFASIQTEREIEQP